MLVGFPGLGSRPDLSTNLRLLRISPDTPLTGSRLKSLGSLCTTLRSGLAWRHPSLDITRDFSFASRSFAACATSSRSPKHRPEKPSDQLNPISPPIKSRSLIQRPRYSLGYQISSPGLQIFDLLLALFSSGPSQATLIRLVWPCDPTLRASHLIPVSPVLSITCLRPILACALTCRLPGSLRKLP